MHLLKVNLTKDLVDGLRLICLVEIIYETRLVKEFGDRRLGMLKLHRVKNHETCLGFLRTRARLQCVGIHPYGLAEGNTKMIIALVFQIKNDFESRMLVKKSKRNVSMDQNEYTSSKLSTSFIWSALNGGAGDELNISSNSLAHSGRVALMRRKFAASAQAVPAGLVRSKSAAQMKHTPVTKTTVSDKENQFLQGDL